MDAYDSEMEDLRRTTYSIVLDVKRILYSTLDDALSKIHARMTVHFEAEVVGLFTKQLLRFYHLAIENYTNDLQKIILDCNSCISPEGSTVDERQKIGQNDMNEDEEIEELRRELKRTERSLAAVAMMRDKLDEFTMKITNSLGFVEELQSLLDNAMPQNFMDLVSSAMSSLNLTD